MPTTTSCIDPVFGQREFSHGFHFAGWGYYRYQHCKQLKPHSHS